MATYLKNPMYGVVDRSDDSCVQRLDIVTLWTQESVDSFNWMSSCSGWWPLDKFETAEEAADYVAMAMAPTVAGGFYPDADYRGGVE